MKDHVRRFLLAAGIATVALIVSFSFGNMVKADESEIEQEPNDSFQQANLIKEGITYTGYLTVSNDDYFKFVLPESGVFQMYAADWDIEYSIYDSNHKFIDSPDGYKGTISAKLPKGTYYLKFDYNGGYYDAPESNYYGFYYKFFAADKPFTKTNTDDSMEKAVTVKLDTAYYGQLAENDWVDYHKFKMEEEGQLIITFDSKINHRFQLLDSDGKELDKILIGNSSKYEKKYDLTEGTYYLVFKQYEGARANGGNYSFSLSYNDPNATILTSPLTFVCGETFSYNPSTIGTGTLSWKTSDAKIVSVDSKGQFSCNMAGTASITVACGKKKIIQPVLVLYKDVTKDSDFWYEPTNYLTAAGVVKGYDNQTLFKPANECSRAQMVTFLWRLSGSPNPKSKTTTFKDIKTSDYFYKPVLWAVEKGITTGVTKEKFNPKGICTRAQTVTFLWRMANKPEPKAKTSKFTDIKAKDYYYKAAIWASEKKILAGYADNTFRPDGHCL
ncbi:MAG: S-layer homology domain-containing protein, partial [Saccharofermentans sp.]|nr:S-layer homology domain-containing protein [Saccharofermentans sp.]